MRIAVFVISALAAVTAGILLGGFGGVSVDVGVGLELQAIAACVVGGVQLMGGRGTLVGAVAGALTLTALFTLLILLGWPQPLKETAQGVILIIAVAFGASADAARDSGPKVRCISREIRRQGGKRKVMRLFKLIAPAVAGAALAAAAPYAASAQNFDDPEEFQAAQDLLKMTPSGPEESLGSRIWAARMSIL